MDDRGDHLPASTDTAFARVPIEILVTVGRARPKVRDLLALRPESVLPLDRRVDDPVELYIGDEMIATAELIELDGEAQGQLAVRLVEVRKNGGDR